MILAIVQPFNSTISDPPLHLFLPPRLLSSQDLPCLFSISSMATPFTPEQIAWLQATFGAVPGLPQDTTTSGHAASPRGTSGGSSGSTRANRADPGATNAPTPTVGHGQPGMFPLP